MLLMEGETLLAPSPATGFTALPVADGRASEVFGQALKRLRLGLVFLGVLLLHGSFLLPLFATEVVRLPGVMPPSEPILGLLASFPETNTRPFSSPMPPSRVEPGPLLQPTAPSPWGSGNVRGYQQNAVMDEGFGTDGVLGTSDGPILVDGLGAGSEMIVGPISVVDEENIWNRPIDARNTFFQEARFTTTWLARGKADRDFGETELELKGYFALPLPTKRHPMVLMPGFAVHYLDGPKEIDIPSRLYDTYVQFRWAHKLGPKWAAEVSVTPGVFSDFEQGTDEAIRITGHVGVMWDWRPDVQLIFGVAYLDREDLRILPAAGIVWKPNPEWEVAMTVPRPSVSRRLYCFGSLEDKEQDWLYVAGELGGGTWAVLDQASDRTYQLTYRDLRAILGMERRVLFAPDWRMEVAYCFARKLDNDIGLPISHPSSTVMVRGGIVY